MWAHQITLEELKKIVEKSIAHLDPRDFWMITWIDRAGVSDDGTPYVKASVHRVKSVELKNFRVESLDLKKPQWISIPLRLLRIFPVGTLLKSGTVMFKSHLGYLPDFKIDLDSASGHEHTTLGKWKHGEAFIKAMALNLLDSGFPKSEAKRFAANSKILVYPNKKRSQANYDFMIFPATELARFYWFPSTKLFRALMDGKASSDLRNELYVPVSAIKNGEEYYEILVRDAMHLRDAEFIARLAFSSEALKSANTIYRSVINAKLESGNKGSLHLDCIFPFNDDTSLNLKGYTINLGNVTILNVTEILKCYGPWPFKKLAYDHETPRNEVDETREKKGLKPVPSQHPDDNKKKQDDGEDQDIEDEFGDFVLKRDSFIKGDKDFNHNRKNNNRARSVEYTEKGSKFPTMPREKKRLDRRKTVPPKNTWEGTLLPITNISVNENTESGGDSTNIEIINPEDEEKEIGQVGISKFIVILCKEFRTKGAVVDYVVMLDEESPKSTKWYQPDRVAMIMPAEGKSEVHMYMVYIRFPKKREYILCEMDQGISIKVVIKNKLDENNTVCFNGPDIAAIVEAVDENFRTMGKLNENKSGFSVIRLYHMSDTAKELCGRIIAKVDQEGYGVD